MLAVKLRCECLLRETGGGATHVYEGVVPTEDLLREVPAADGPALRNQVQAHVVVEVGVTRPL